MKRRKIPNRTRTRSGLTDTAIRQAKPGKKRQRLTDGRGLYMLVQPSGGKWWRFDYRYGGKRKTLSLGTYPDVTLAHAREKLLDARRMLQRGLDPSLERKKEKIAKANTFADVANAWHTERQVSWSPEHIKLVRYRMERYLFPGLGSRPVSEIEPPEVLQLLKALGPRLETARRIKQIAGMIFRYAVYNGMAQRDPTADLKGALTPPVQKPRAALTVPREVGALLRAIAGYDGYSVVRHALRLAPYVFVRPGELRHMEWKEIDFDAKEWRIPAEKMKMRQAHLVPLADQVIAILEELKPITGRSQYVFPGVRSYHRPISENTMNAALRRLGYTKTEMTSHGFRAMASTLLNEQGWPPDIIERQLAHAERNKVRAAYNRAEYLSDRRKMMQAWADYLDTLTDTV